MLIFRTQMLSRGEKVRFKTIPLELRGKVELGKEYTVKSARQFQDVHHVRYCCGGCEHPASDMPCSMRIGQLISLEEIPGDEHAFSSTHLDLPEIPASRI
ncbi:MAG: hypothetical protein KGI60_01935 [Patescibacteria group bacterium]|nr:hypothetical protein [Patescibacteria group bacterium]